MQMWVGVDEDAPPFGKQTAAEAVWLPTVVASTKPEQIRRMGSVIYPIKSSEWAGWS